MPKEEIVEGLRQAVSKGEPLEKAMASFYNSGYLKEDIEEAARVLQTPSLQPQFQSQFQQYFQPQQKIPGQALPYSRVVQRVSDYGKKPGKSGAAIIIILFSLLLLLLGILAAVILFKEELSGLFSSFLGVL